jgi:uncharacterized protein with GYD domain
MAAIHLAVDTGVQDLVLAVEAVDQDLVLAVEVVVDSEVEVALDTTLALALKKATLIINSILVISF